MLGHGSITSSCLAGAVLLLLSSNINNCGGVNAQECDQCLFTSEDAADCKVYGKIDGELIPWLKASQDCIDVYGNNVASIDPFSVGCDPVSVNTFVNSGISGGNIPNSILGGLGVAEGGFFVQQTQGGTYVLKDSITVTGTTYDCEASATSCYNAMKDYFQTTSGANEMNDVCSQILNRVLNDREREQTSLRNRLCREAKDGNTLDSSCANLAAQVEERLAAKPDEGCANYAFGTQNTVIPGCQDQNVPINNNNTTSNNNDTSSGFLVTNALSVSFLMALPLWFGFS